MCASPRIPAWPNRVPHRVLRTEFVDEVKRGEIKVYTFSSRSTNQRGELVCEGTWTNFVR